jgi:hypothetical protein
MIEALNHYFAHITAYLVNGMPEKNFRTPFNSFNLPHFSSVLACIFGQPPGSASRFMVRFSLVRNTDI